MNLIVRLAAISVLLFSMCNTYPKVDTLTKEQEQAYMDSAHSVLMWMFSSDSVIQWPVLKDKVSNKYFFVDSSERIVADTFLLQKAQFSVGAVRKVDSVSLIFTKQDTAFMKSILSTISGLTINKSFPKVSLLTLDVIRNNQLFNNYYKTLTLPLFTPDYQIAIVEINNMCRPQCGYGEMLTLKRENNGWVITQRNMTWIN